MLTKNKIFFYDYFSFQTMADFKITNAVNRLLKYVSTLSCYFTFGPNLLTITADTLIEGDLTVEGNASFKEDVQIDNNTSIGGSLHVSSNIIGNGDLDISGNTNLVGDLEVCGDAHFKQDVTIDGNLVVNGSITTSDFVLFSPTNRIPISNQASYNAIAGQYFLAVTSMNQPLTIQLPSSPATKQNFYIVTDESGSASTYPITIVPPLGGTISGANQMVLQVSYGTIWFYSIANTNTYYVMFTRP
jgi:cytoskeletal protein CcmA (bactofilin family)